MRHQGFRSYFSYEAVLGATKSFVFGSCLFFVGTLLEWWLTHLNVKSTFLLLDNALAAVAAGLMMLFDERHRQRELKKKAETIRQMNRKCQSKHTVDRLNPQPT